MFCLLSTMMMISHKYISLRRNILKSIAENMWISHRRLDPLNITYCKRAMDSIFLIINAMSYFIPYGLERDDIEVLALNVQTLHATN